MTSINKRNDSSLVFTKLVHYKIDDDDDCHRHHYDYREKHVVVVVVVVVVQHSVTRVMAVERQWHGIVMGATAAASSQVHVHVGWTVLPT
jgi:hypothetical protein